MAAAAEVERNGGGGQLHRDSRWRVCRVWSGLHTRSYASAPLPTTLLWSPPPQVANLTQRLAGAHSELARARQEYRANDIIAIGLRDQIYRLRQQLAAANTHIQAQVGGMRQGEGSGGGGGGGGWGDNARRVGRWRGGWGEGVGGGAGHREGVRRQVTALLPWSHQQNPCTPLTLLAPCMDAKYASVLYAELGAPWFPPFPPAP
jgi:hypothetical protein